MTNRKTLLSIGLVADLHYAPITVGTRCCSESLTKLKAATAELTDHELDAFLCLGDVIDKSDTVEAELACIDEVRQVLASCGAETHFVLGNHDVSELTKTQFLKAVGAERPYYSFDCRGVHIVILDSNINPDGSDFAPGNFHWADAWIGEEQLTWLEDDLKTAGSTPTLVFCHANLDHRVLKTGELNGHIVRDAARVRAILESTGNVQAVIQGHDHSGHRAVIGGIPYLGLRAMVEGSGLEQNAFGLFQLFEDGGFALKGFGQQASVSAVDLPAETARFLSPPVIQHAGAHGFALSIEVSGLSMGRVEWGFAEDALIHTAVTARAGLVQADERCLVFTVSFDQALQPGQKVYYRVVAESLKYVDAYEIERGTPFHTEVRRLRLPHETEERVRLAVINDTHNRRRTMPPLVDLVEKVDPDLLVWNGDICAEFNEGDDPHVILLRPGGGGATPSSGGWASCRPLLYVPGNHDRRGVRARELHSIFPQGPYPELPYNTAFRFGPAAIISLDGGEDKSDDHPVLAGTAAYEPHREQQADWLAEQLRRPEILAAPFKLAFCHYPLRRGPDEPERAPDGSGSKHSEHGGRIWLPQLTEAGFHAIISGHTHKWRFDPPSEEHPITQIVGGGPSPETATLLEIDISKTEMTICTMDLDGQILAREAWSHEGESGA